MPRKPDYKREKKLREEAQRKRNEEAQQRKAARKSPTPERPMTRQSTPNTLIVVANDPPRCSNGCGQGSRSRSKLARGAPPRFARNNSVPVAHHREVVVAVVARAGNDAAHRGHAVIGL